MLYRHLFLALLHYEQKEHGVLVFGVFEVELVIDLGHPCTELCLKSDLGTRRHQNENLRITSVNKFDQIFLSSFAVINYSRFAIDT